MGGHFGNNEGNLASINRVNAKDIIKSYGLGWKTP